MLTIVQPGGEFRPHLATQPAHPSPTFVPDKAAVELAGHEAPCASLLRIGAIGFADKTLDIGAKSAALAVSRLLCVSDERVWRVLDHYVTMFSDADVRRFLFAPPSKDAATFKKLTSPLAASGNELVPR